MKSRNQYELTLMRKSGKIAASALSRAVRSVKVGVTELEVDEAVKNEIYKLGGDLSYKTVPGYKYATCITVNEQVVHGIPTTRKFETGDIVSIDLAVMYKGWHTDCAWTVLLGSDKEKEKFLQIGEQALWESIKQAVPGNKVGDISSAIQKRVEEGGYDVVRSLVGHGVGKSLHEDPQIPGAGVAGTGPFLKEASTLAIEVIYAEGKADVVLAPDNWTFETEDKSWGGLFEMTVIVDQHPEVLTDWRKVYPFYGL